MNIQTGREFTFTNPQDDPHLYANPPAGFSYRYDGTLIAVPRARPIFPTFSHRSAQTQQPQSLSATQIRNILQNGQFLPNARGPGKNTFCDVCQKRDLRQSIAYQDFDICLECAQKY